MAGHGGETPVLLPTRWPKEGGALDRWDKRLSSPIFRLQLGPAAEVVLSFPGCWFGMPSFHALSPALLAYALTDEPRPLALPLLAAVGCALLGAWGAVIGGGGIKYARQLYSPHAVLVAPFIGTAVAHGMTADACATGAASFFLLTWFSSVIPVLQLKRLAERQRPIACALRLMPEVADAASRKSLDVLPTMYGRDGNGSLPSGDVAGAVCFAFPLWCCGGYSLLPLACVSLSCFGRVYWLAHHLLDVAVSLVLTALVTSSLHVFVSSNDLCLELPPWVPLVPLSILLVQIKLLPAVQAALTHGSGKSDEKAK